MSKIVSCRIGSGMEVSTLKPNRIVDLWLEYLVIHIIVGKAPPGNRVPHKEDHAQQDGDRAARAEER